MSIADFRALDEGGTGKVEGIITTVPGSWVGDCFAIQDETGGVYVDISGHNFSMDDLVSISESKDLFNGEFQIGAAESELIEADQTVPAPRVELMTDITKDDEGQIMKLENVEITNIDLFNFDTFEFTAVSGADSFLIRVDNLKGVDANNFAFSEGDMVDVSGLVAEYQVTLQLKPRFEDDVVTAQ